MLVDAEKSSELNVLIIVIIRWKIDAKINTILECVKNKDNNLYERTNEFFFSKKQKRKS